MMVYDPFVYSVRVFRCNGKYLWICRASFEFEPWCTRTRPVGADVSSFDYTWLRSAILQGDKTLNCSRSLEETIGSVRRTEF